MAWRNRWRRAVCGLLALLWMGGIFWLSAQPDLPHAPEPWLDRVLRKGGHAVLFGVLALLYLGALQGDGPPSPRDRWLALGLTVLYALSDEFHQSFVPGRTPSLWDVLIDGVGAVLALVLIPPRQPTTSPSSTPPGQSRSGRPRPRRSDG